MAHTSKFLCDPLDLSLQVLLGFLVQIKLKTWHAFQLLPPALIPLLKALPTRRPQMMSMRNTVHAVHYQLSALRDQLPLLANMLRRHPHRGHQVGCQQTR